MQSRQSPLRPRRTPSGTPPVRPRPVPPATAEAAATRQRAAGRSNEPTGPEPLPAPAELRRALPLAAEGAHRIAGARAAIADVLHGRDAQRLVVVAGPCSVHDRDGALAYAHRLAAAASWHRRELVVVMRAYVEKPRSGPGWKGFLNDPDLDGRCDARTGLVRSRELLLAIAGLGLPCASELLDPIAFRYLEDLLAWSTLGARTAASQPHRELASALPLPIGVKNPLDGDVGVAVEGAAAAHRPQRFLGIDACGRAASVRSPGNPDAHVVLRGGRDGANHGARAVAAAAALAEPLGLARPLFVDCSHANSGKDHARQPRVCRELLAQVRDGRREIAGLLLESHLEPGRQDLEPGRRPHPARSITDACIGWEDTARLLDEAAEAVRAGLR